MFFATELQTSEYASLFTRMASSFRPAMNTRVARVLCRWWANEHSETLREATNYVCCLLRKIASKKAGH